LEKQEIGKKIREIRKKLGLTQEQLAQKAEIPYATLIKIENGHVVNPTINTLQKIALALGVTVDELLVKLINVKHGTKEKSAI